MAKRLRETMVAPSLMQLEMELRVQRQCEVAKPLMDELISHGLDSGEAVWRLISDDDESVRRSSIILLVGSRTDAAGKPIVLQTLLELHIPILERAITSTDNQVRLIACDALGNFVDWSDDCLERLGTTLPKLRELQNDRDKKVRSVGWMASNKIAAALSTRAKKPEDRDAAVAELQRLQQEKNW